MFCLLIGTTLGGGCAFSIDATTDSAQYVQDSTDHDRDRVRLSNVVISEGGRTTILIEGSDIVAVGSAALAGHAYTIDMDGKAVVPSFIDSHVHLAYLPVDPTPGGIVAAIDLAAPIEWLNKNSGDLTVLSSGPMITADGGYPTTSWGQNGYGLECADGDAAVAAVNTLIDTGASLIKLPITGGAALSEEALTQVVDQAHNRGVRVVSHAMDDATVDLAHTVGVDVLAHTPTSPLSDATIQAWSEKTVITTLSAFGNSQTARDNLSALRAAGTMVLYGTDHGNLHTTGISSSEINAMRDAGMNGADIIAAATRSPADHWGLDHLGSIAPGKEASFLVIDGNPWKDPMLLASPMQTWLAGSLIYESN